jgi:hypothetical protein
VYNNEGRHLGCEAGVGYAKRLLLGRASFSMASAHCSSRTRRLVVQAKDRCLRPVIRDRGGYATAGYPMHALPLMSKTQMTQHFGKLQSVVQTTLQSGTAAYSRFRRVSSQTMIFLALRLAMRPGALRRADRPKKTKKDTKQIFLSPEGNGEGNSEVEVRVASVLEPRASSVVFPQEYEVHRSKWGLACKGGHSLASRLT